MIMSNKRTAVMPRWLTGCLLLTTFCLLPLGVAYGQDYDAVQRRLGKAVGEGEITLQQANAMMAALKKSAATTPAKSKPLAKAQYNKLLAEVKAAAEAGKISKQQAEEKYNALRKLLAEEEARARAATTEYEETLRKVKAAAAAEKISAEEARDKFEALRKEYAKAAEAAMRLSLEKSQRAEKKPTYEGVLERVKAAIKAGQITEEQGKERLEAFRRQMAEETAKRFMKAPGKEQARSREVELKQAMTMIRAAIASGEISKEDGAKKMEAIRAAVIEREKITAERTAEESRRKARWAAVMQELEEAVKNGDISREQAEEKMRALKEKMSSGGR